MHGGIELLSLPGKMLMLEIEVPTDIIMRVVFSFPPFRTMRGTCNSVLPFRLSSCPKSSLSSHYFGMYNFELEEKNMRIKIIQGKKKEKKKHE